MQAAKAWQQHLRLPTTGSAGTYLTACLLQKRQNVSSSFITLDKKNNISRLWRREEFLKICIEKGLAENAQGNRGYNTSQKKSEDTVQPSSRVFLRKSFMGQVTGWGRHQ